MEKLYAYALAQMKTCSHAKVTLLHEEAEEAEEDEEESVKIIIIIIYLYFIPGVIFSFYTVNFLHVLHLDVLKRQIEIETETEN